jgi:uncharacterized membrane protein YphA (DoxX/SURF4 family)
MKFRAMGYWASTSVIALAFLMGGAVDVARPPSAVAFIEHLGYPAYFSVIIGVWKVLGGLALLAPRLPRLKEWAYAGIVFDLTGAAISHAVTGDAAQNVIVPLVLSLVAVASWCLRPESRKLGFSALASV